MDDFLFNLIELIQSIADGLLFGATYAIIGIGFTLIFGVIDPRLARYALRGEALLAFDFGLSARKLALGSRHNGARGLEFDPMVRWIDPKQRIAFLEKSAGYQPG